MFERERDLKGDIDLVNMRFQGKEPDSWKDWTEKTLLEWPQNDTGLRISGCTVNHTGLTYCILTVVGNISSQSLKG